LYDERINPRRANQLSGRNWQEHPRAAQLIDPSGCVI
jgi:hypothetical protein